MQKETRTFYWDWNDEDQLPFCNNHECAYINEKMICIFPEPLPRDAITNFCLVGSTIREIEEKEKQIKEK